MKTWLRMQGSRDPRGAAVLFGGFLREEFRQRLLRRAATRKQILRSNAESSSEAKQFVVGYAPNLRLDLGERPATDVPPLKANTSGQLVLSQAELKAKLSDLWADDVLSGSLAHVARGCGFSSPYLLRYHSNLFLPQRRLSPDAWDMSSTVIRLKSLPRPCGIHVGGESR